jgi:hypothetical protein
MSTGGATEGDEKVALLAQSEEQDKLMGQRQLRLRHWRAGQEFPFKPGFSW